MEKIEKDLALLKGLAANHATSIEHIYKENYNMVRQLVMTNSGSEDDAADVFQDTMVVLFEKAASPEFQLQCQLKTYIYSVSRRLWLKKLQQYGRFMKVESMEDTAEVEEDLEEHQKMQSNFVLMESSMQKIGEPCKGLLEAYYIKKKQMQEIAVEFGYTNADNAKTQKYKCLVRLKKLFFAEYKNL